MIIVVDDEDRENEGDLVAFAEKVDTRSAINFMIKHGRGLVCVPMTEERARRIWIFPSMVQSKYGPAWNGLYGIG